MPWGEFHGGQLPRGELVRGNRPGDRSPGVIVQRGISWGAIVQGGQLSRGEMSGYQIYVIKNFTVNCFVCLPF